MLIYISKDRRQERQLTTCRRMKNELVKHDVTTNTGGGFANFLYHH
jgi:hypothetical protein